jgi:hypothetical protein
MKASLAVFTPLLTSPLLDVAKDRSIAYYKKALVTAPPCFVKKTFSVSRRF